MISRLTASATVFAAFATVGIAFAADAQQRLSPSQTLAARAMPTIVLPRVEVVGQRVARR